jgi:hypothetical protein
MLNIINFLNVVDYKSKHELIIEIEFKTLIYKKTNVNEKNMWFFSI